MKNLTWVPVLGSVIHLLQFQSASCMALARLLKDGVSKAPAGYLCFTPPPKAGSSHHIFQACCLISTCFEKGKSLDCISFLQVTQHGQRGREETPHTCMQSDLGKTRKAEALCCYPSSPLAVTHPLHCAIICAHKYITIEGLLCSQRLSSMAVIWFCHGNTMLIHCRHKSEFCMAWQRDFHRAAGWAHWFLNVPKREWVNGSF